MGGVGTGALPLRVFANDLGLLYTNRRGDRMPRTQVHLKLVLVLKNVNLPIALWV
ncbi:MAG: hypothetical protein WBC69_18510 [Geitlerinemataceae cyanobacterium]